MFYKYFDKSLMVHVTSKIILSFYHLPTRGRAGVKLGDVDTLLTYPSFLMFHPWFLFTFLCFVHTLEYFLYTFLDKPINKMPQCHLPVFCYFWFQESQKMNILGIGPDKSQSRYLTGRLTEPEDETERGHSVATPCGGAG